MTQSKRLTIILLLNIAMIAGLIVVGLSSHSLGVLAAGGDYVADSAAIALGLIAIKMRDDKHGHSMATTVVAAINASFLLIVTVFVIGESLHRLTTHNPDIHVLQAMIISLVATVAMVVGAVIISRDAAEEDLHMRSVLLDMLADAASSGAVAITGGIIYFAKGLYWLDSAVALVIGIVIGFTALKLLRDVMKTLRHTNIKG
jgi:cobalt-zinc-cadmium efflux system protein